MQSIVPDAQALDQRLAVVLGAQRRVHLEAGVEAAHRLVGERQVVRGRLAGDLRRPPALARAIASTDSRAERCWTWIARVLVARRAQQSRAIIVDSEIDGIPARPSAAETAPSCMTPVAGELGVLLVQGDRRRRRAAGTGAPGAARARCGSAGRRRRSRRRPASRSSAISVSSSPSMPRVTVARKPDRAPRPRVGARSRSARRPAAESTAARCSPSRAPRSSRRPRRRACRSRGPPCPRRPGVRRWTWGSKKAGKREQPLGLDDLGALGAVGRAPGSASSAISPPRTTRSQVRVEVRRAGRAAGPRGAAARAGARRRAAPVERGDSGRGAAHAGCPIGVGSAGVGAAALGAPARSRAGEQLVEDRHPHHQAARDLVGDQRLRGVDHLGRQLDAAVDRARVHQQLARPEPAGVDLVAGGVLAQRGHEALAHALALHPQRVDDVGLAEPVEVVGDLAAERLDSRAGSASAGRRRSPRRPSC